jgi:hypothetical protein
MRKYKKKEKGSIMILTVMAVLILSVMVTGLLNVGTTEIYTTQNYQLDKTAYFTAVQGAEEVRNLIYNTPDPESVTTIKRYPNGIEGPNISGENPAYGTSTDLEGINRSYITGSLKELEAYYAAGGSSSALHYVDQLKGFEAPPLPSISMGGGASVAPVIWKVNITAEVKMGKRVSYSEVITGVYSIITISY